MFSQRFTFFYFFLICFVLFARSLSAQDSLAAPEPSHFELDSIKRYDFIKYDKNFIIKPEALQSFLKKLTQLEKGEDRKVQIFHIGDSHIQADFFTGEVRKLFRQAPQFPYSGRGFVFPYKVAKTNSPFDYQSTSEGYWQPKNAQKRDHFSRWGVAGLNVVSTDSKSTLTVQLKPFRGLTPLKHERIRVFFPHTDTASFVPTFLEEHKNLRATYLSNEGYLEVLLREPTDSFTIGLLQNNASQNHFLFQGLFLENDKPGIVYSTAGVNGATLETFLRCADFAHQLALTSPDLVVISLGTNDAYPFRFSPETYQENYEKLLQRIREKLPEVPIILTTAGDNYRYRRHPNPNNKKVSEICHALSEQFSNVAVWDFYEVMGGYKSVVYWQAAGLGRRDKIHLSQKGYKHQGELFFEALMRAYEGYKGK